MVPPTRSKTTDAHRPEAWAWGRSLGAAAWPLLCALAFAAYAFFPGRFPEQTSQSMLLLIAAEFPALFIGIAHATALTERTRAGRMKTFFIGIGTLGLIGTFHFGLDIDFRTLAPMVFWVLVPYVIALWWDNDDPALVSRQAEAVLEDKMHMFALIPVLVVGGVLLAMATVAVLAGISIASGVDLPGKLSGLLHEANPSLLALIGSAYLLVSAASESHVHRPRFVHDRKRLLDRPWINALTRQLNKR